MGSAPWPLVLVGPVGCGKTCAALCLADRVVGTIYWQLKRFCGRLIDTGKGQVVSKSGYTLYPEDLWSYWFNSTLAIMDELGRRHTTSDSSVLQRAIEARPGRPAIFISNFNLAELHTMYGDHVASRLAQGSRFTFPADSPDYRVSKEPHDGKE